MSNFSDIPFSVLDLSPVIEGATPPANHAPIKLRLDINRSEKLILIDDEKEYFPELAVITIKK